MLSHFALSQTPSRSPLSLKRQRNSLGWINSVIQKGVSCYWTGVWSVLVSIQIWKRQFNLFAAVTVVCQIPASLSLFAARRRSFGNIIERGSWVMPSALKAAIYALNWQLLVKQLTRQSPKTTLCLSCSWNCSRAPLHFVRESENWALAM